MNHFEMTWFGFSCELGLVPVWGEVEQTELDDYCRLTGLTQVEMQLMHALYTQHHTDNGNTKIFDDISSSPQRSVKYIENIVTHL